MTLVAVSFAIPPPPVPAVLPEKVQPLKVGEELVLNAPPPLAVVELPEKRQSV